MSETNQDTADTTAMLYHPPEAVTEQMLPIEKIRMDGKTQTREGLNQKVVSAYAAEMRREGASPFPPIDVFEDPEGCYWPADGLHRLAAAKCNDQTEIMARVYRGTRLNALMHSANANHQHGLMRTNADKRRCVEMMLAESAFQGEGNRQIARWCGVGDQLVGQVRRRLEKENQVRESRTSSFSGKRRGKDGKNYPAAKKLGTKKDAPRPPLPTPAQADTEGAAAPAGAQTGQENADEKQQADLERPRPEKIKSEEEPVEPREREPAPEPGQAGTPESGLVVERKEVVSLVKYGKLPAQAAIADGTMPEKGASPTAGQQDWDDGIISRERVEERLAQIDKVSPSDRYTVAEREAFRGCFAEYIRAINRSAVEVCVAASIRQQVATDAAVAVGKFISSSPKIVS